ncbi:MAG: hypothetical protein NT076_01590, partial [Candidatus Pacearchaeota archaeon]|nr:hypothetical protein [Candidatus Pacearchaeota archaeon]
PQQKAIIRHDCNNLAINLVIDSTSIYDLASNNKEIDLTEIFVGHNRGGGLYLLHLFCQENSAIKVDYRIQYNENMGSIN